MARPLTKVFVVFFVGLLFGIGLTIAGVELFWSLAPRDEPPGSVLSEINFEDADSVEPVVDSAGDQSTRSPLTAREIEEILQSSLDFERPLILNSLLADTDAQALGVLLDQSKDLNESRFKRELQTGLIRLLASTDPGIAIERISALQDTSKEQLIAAVFEEWSLANLEEAVEFAQGMEKSDQAAALEGIFWSRIDLSQRQIVKIGQRMATTDDVERVVVLRLTEVAAHDPENLWYLLVDSYGSDVNSLSDGQLQSLVHVASSLFDRSGLQAVQAISSSLGKSESRIAVLGELFAGIARNDPKGAFDLVMQVNGLDREVIERVMQVWAGTAPLNALAAATESSDARGWLQRVAIDEWASTNPISLFQSMDKLPTLMRAWARNQALYSMAETAPDSAIDLLAEIDDDGLRRSVSQRLANHWPEQDLSAAFDWSMSNEKITREMRAEMQQAILGRMARIDPEVALKLALDQEISDTEPGLEANVISGVAEVSVDSALDMLEKARNQATREKAYSSIGSALVRKGRYLEAIELVQDASLQVQREYYNQVAYAWARADFNSLLESKESLPDDWIIRDIVEGAIGIYRW